MAYVQIATLGSGAGSKFSVFKDVAKVTESLADGQNVGNNTTFFNDTFSFIGCNINELVEFANVNEVIPLAHFKDGTFIGFIVTSATNDYDYGTSYPWTLFARSVRLHHFNSDNTIKTRLMSDNYQLGLRTHIKIKATGEIVKGKSYIMLAVDEETKSATWRAYVSDPSSYSTELRTLNRNIINYGGSTSTLYNVISGKYSEYDPDPWSNAGYAGIGGGGGSFDFASDVIGLPDIPSIDATSTGFLQLYSASLSQVRDLAAYLWTDDFLTNLVKVTQDPLSIIMSLSMYPFAIPATATKRVCAGNVETPVIMAVPDKQFYEIDCGNFPVPSFYGAYLDYEPFAKCDIFLPYCGTHALSLDDIVGATLNVRYRVDLLSGACVAYVLVDGCVRYTFAGMCAMNIPITSQNFLTNYTAILGLAATSINALSTPTMSAASDVASNVMQCKPSISRGGGTASNMGFMGVQTPMLIFTVPRVAIPKGQAKHTGYPVFATYKLSDLKGYTEIEEILTVDFGRATSAEVSEIDKLLKGGVIL